MATSLGVSAGLTLMILVTVPYLETGLFLEQMLLDSESDWNMDLQNAVQSGLKALLFLFLANLHYSYYSCSDLLRLHHISACHMGNSGLRLHQLVSVRTFIFLRKKWHSGCLTKRSVLATYNHSGGSRLIYIYISYIYTEKDWKGIFWLMCCFGYLQWLLTVGEQGFSDCVSPKSCFGHPQRRYTLLHLLRLRPGDFVEWTFCEPRFLDERFWSVEGLDGLGAHWVDLKV